jgi:flagellar basal-body rod protein FlgC
MSSFKIFDVAGSGMSAQSVRLNTVASNLANADSVSGDPNTVYKARHPVFQAIKQAAALRLSSPGGFGISPTDQASGAAVKVSSIVESTAPATERYDPGNPLADEHGNVYAPNVNVIEEMTDMISASRAYQDNVEVMSTSKDLMLATLKLGE